MVLLGDHAPEMTQEKTLFNDLRNGTENTSVELFAIHDFTGVPFSLGPTQNSN